jgi:hypothetical protein
MRAWVIVLLMSVVGCNRSDRCVPGEQRSCACDNALVGAQVCNAEGTFGACAACAFADAAVDDARADGPLIDAAIDAPADAALAVTGEPCTKAQDCAGVGRQCVAIPGGYCSSSCNPQHLNLTTGLSQDCPGAGWCTDLGAGGQCFAACTAASGVQPCRTGYACFDLGCLPASFSECDPTVAGSCGVGNTCLTIGADPVGQCGQSCDLFAQDCASGGCYVANMAGDAACAVSSGVDVGMACRSINDCLPGLDCHQDGQLKTCRAYCGGPASVACATGTCVDYSASLPTAIVGVCQ